MDRLKRSWKRTPRSVRRPLVLTVGLSLVIAAAPIGAIPGPGGMIVFLLGIAILSSEFRWAERLRDYLVSLGKQFRDYLAVHRGLAITLWIGGAAWILSVAWYVWLR